MFQVPALEHKTTPAPFMVTYIGFHRDPDLPDLAYGKIVFYNPYSELEYTTSFQFNMTSFHIIPYFPNVYSTHVIPSELIDTDKDIPSDDPNNTNLTVPQYECEKQHNLRQFNFLKLI